MSDKPRVLRPVWTYNLWLAKKLLLDKPRYTTSTVDILPLACEQIVVGQAKVYYVHCGHITFGLRTNCCWTSQGILRPVWAYYLWLAKKLLLDKPRALRPLWSSTLSLQRNCCWTSQGYYVQCGHITFGLRSNFCWTSQRHYVHCGLALLACKEIVVGQAKGTTSSVGILPLACEEIVVGQAKGTTSTVV